MQEQRHEHLPPREPRHHGQDALPGHYTQEDALDTAFEQAEESRQPVSLLSQTAPPSFGVGVAPGGRADAPQKQESVASPSAGDEQSCHRWPHCLRPPPEGRHARRQGQGAAATNVLGEVGRPLPDSAALFCHRMDCCRTGCRRTGRRRCCLRHCIAGTGLVAVHLHTCRPPGAVLASPTSWPSRPARRPPGAAVAVHHGASQECQCSQKHARFAAKSRSRCWRQ
mmetsp:Transcript_130071/g.277836  ORF Transcript_130071/g.277836 Transcript_130071/m.277836 type:complete len:225 (-) Transcript_130071:214-888(-)